jgi:biopolymer transport protein ExbD
MAEINTQSGKEPQAKVRCTKSSVKIDMTPMVDLAFLLLTFFILTTQLNDPQVMPLKMPDEQEPGDPEPSTVNDKRVVTFVLGDDNKVFYYTGLKDPIVSETNFGSKGLRKVLLAKKKEISGLVVLIKPSEESNYANLVDILDEMAISNVPNYYVTPVTETDKELIKVKG